MRILAVLLCSSVLVAQAKSSPLRYVPRDADVVMRLAGPAVWRRDFAATGLGKAFADPQLIPIWDRVLKYFASTFEFGDEALGEQDRARFEAMWSELRDYSGDVVFTGRVDWDAVDLNKAELPGAALVALGRDGKVEPARLVEKLTAMLPEETVGELELGGVAAPLRSIGRTQLAGPFVHEGHVVFLFGLDLETRATWFFEERVDRAWTESLGAAPFEMKVNLKGVVEIALESFGGPQGVRGQTALMEFLGLRALHGLSFSVYPDGKYVGQKMELKFGAESRGLIDAFVPPRSKRPSLMRFLPAGAGTYSAAPMDIAALQLLYEQGMARFADEVPLTREELERQFAEMTKVDLFKDIIAHIGDEYMRIEDVAGDSDYDEDDPDAVAKAKEKYADSCYVIKLRDGRALAKSVDTAIRARGLHVGRKREDYGGTDIYRMTLLGMLPIEYAVTDSFFVLGVGGGEGTRQNLRGVLDSAKAVASGGGDTPLAKEVLARLEDMPADWCGIQVASFVDILGGVTGGFADLEAMFAQEGLEEADLDESWRLVFDASAALKSVLPRHGAGVTVNVDYYHKDRYVMRSRW